MIGRAELGLWAASMRWEAGREGIEHFSACPEGLKWIASLPEDASAAEAWDRCDRPEWLTWAARHAGVADDEIRAAVWPAVERVICGELPAALRRRGAAPGVAAFFEGLGALSVREEASIARLREIATALTGATGADLVYWASSLLETYDERPDGAPAVVQELGARCLIDGGVWSLSEWLREERARERQEIRAAFGERPEWLSAVGDVASLGAPFGRSKWAAAAAAESTARKVRAAGLAGGAR